MHSNPGAQRINVLLYIKHPGIASRLTALLTSHNMAVTTAYTLSDLEDAIRIGGVHVATTNTAGIETVRQVTCLPVVNFDAFLFPRAARQNEANSGSSFDRSAFMKRLIEVGQVGFRGLIGGTGRAEGAKLSRR